MCFAAKLSAYCFKLQVPDNANCLFAAFRRHLKITTDFGCLQVRRAIVSYMLDNYEDLFPMFSELVSVCRVGRPDDTAGCPDAYINVPMIR